MNIFVTFSTYFTCTSKSVMDNLRLILLCCHKIDTLFQSGTSQTNMDSDFSTNNEFLTVKKDIPDKVDRDWYNTNACVCADDTRKPDTHKVNDVGVHTCGKQVKLGTSNTTGRFRKRKRGVISRQDAIRCKNRPEMTNDQREDYLEWTKALEELDQACNSHIDVDNAYTGYI